MFQISQLNKGLGNFNYTIDSHMKPYCPFFPGSFGSSDYDGFRVSFATENGEDLVRLLDTEEKSLDEAAAVFNAMFKQVENSVYEAVDLFNSSEKDMCLEYMGIDTSFNPGRDSFPV